MLRSYKCLRNTPNYSLTRNRITDDWQTYFSLYSPQEILGLSNRHPVRAYLDRNNNAGMIRKTDFGKLSRTSIDYAGEENGRWYSVDSNGVIRTHTIVVAGGYYYQTRKQTTKVTSSRTRVSRGRSS